MGFMGSVIKNCRADQVRFSFRMDDGKKGKEYGCVLTVTGYEDGVIYLVSEDIGNGIELCQAPYAAEAFLNSTTSIGTAKRILKLNKKHVVKAVRIELKKLNKPSKCIRVPKDPKLEFSITE